MKKKIIAPSPKFCFNGIKFNSFGIRYCTIKEVNQLRKCPVDIGELRYSTGKVLNKSKPKTKKKEVQDASSNQDPSSN